MRDLKYLSSPFFAFFSNSEKKKYFSTLIKYLSNEIIPLNLKKNDFLNDFLIVKILCVFLNDSFFLIFTFIARK